MIKRIVIAAVLLTAFVATAYVAIISVFYRLCEGWICS